MTCLSLRSVVLHCLNCLILGSLPVHFPLRANGWSSFLHFHILVLFHPCQVESFFDTPLDFLNTHACHQEVHVLSHVDKKVATYMFERKVLIYI